MATINETNFNEGNLTRGEAMLNYCSFIILMIAVFSTNVLGQEKPIISAKQSSPIFPIIDTKVKKELKSDSVKKITKNLPHGSITTIEFLNKSMPVHTIEITTLKQGGKQHTIELKNERSQKNRKITLKDENISIQGDMKKEEVDRLGAAILSVKYLDKNRQPTGLLDFKSPEGGGVVEVNPEGCIYWTIAAIATCGTINPVCIYAGAMAACHCDTDACDKSPFLD